MDHRRKPCPGVGRSGVGRSGVGLGNACAVAVAAWMAAACFVLKEREIASRLEQVEGGTVTLDEPLFEIKVAHTGLWRYCRFQKVIGFGIFEAESHRPERLPVLLMHGHADGPAGLKALAAALDPQRFEPLYAFYPTGQRLSDTVAAMAAALTAYGKAKKIDRIAIVAHSMAGMVARKALGEQAALKKAPAAAMLITLATPWSGSERGARWAWSPSAPPSWKDMSPGSDFLRHLFDNPLPDATAFHVLYAKPEKDAWNIPGPDDGVISIKSATRKEALSEADSVTPFPGCDHREIVKKKEPLEKVAQLLGTIG
jgi:pimeloyl-ACP methyl ester carboxylesterase